MPLVLVPTKTTPPVEPLSRPSAPKSSFVVTLPLTVEPDSTLTASSTADVIESVISALRVTSAVLPSESVTITVTESTLLATFSPPPIAWLYGLASVYVTRPASVTAQSPFAVVELSMTADTISPAPPDTVI